MLALLILLAELPFRFQLNFIDCVPGLTWHVASILEPSTTTAGERDAAKKEEILQIKLLEDSQWLNSWLFYVFYLLRL